MKHNSTRNQTRIQRARRSRAKMSANTQVPRLVVFRSSRHYELALVDSTTGKTIGTVSSKAKECLKLKGKEKIEWLGKQAAEMAKKHNIKQVIYDRAGYKFHGNIAEFARALTKLGIKI